VSGNRGSGFYDSICIKNCLQETPNPENSLKFNLKNRKFKFQHILNNFQNKKRRKSYIFCKPFFHSLSERKIFKKLRKRYREFRNDTKLLFYEKPKHEKEKI
jgi:hypothetical protein